MSRQQSPHRHGRPYRRARTQMFAIYGDLCHLCGHPGARSADHLTPISVWPGQPVDPHLMRPAHGIEGCPTCARKCNTERGAGPLAQAQPLVTTEEW